MNKKLKCVVLLVGAVMCVPQFALADITQDVASNVTATAASQMQAGSAALTQSIEQAPSSLIDKAIADAKAQEQAGQLPQQQPQATLAATTPNTTTAAAPPTQPTVPSTTVPVAPVAPVAPAQGASTVVPPATQVPAPVLQAGPYVGVSSSPSASSIVPDAEINATDPYSSYPEGMGNYNKNAHKDDELIAQESLVADDSVHEDELPPILYNGFSVGLMGNVDLMKGSDERNVPGINNPGGSTNLGLDSTTGGIEANFGYGKVYSRHLYIGGEVFLNYEPYKETGENFLQTTPDGVFTVTTDSTLADVKSDIEFGGVFKIGGVIANRTLIYGLVGIDAANFRITSEKYDVTFNEVIPENFTFSSPDKTKVEAGLNLGFGFETRLVAGLTLRAQYDYIKFQDINDNYSRPDPGAMTSTDVTNKYDFTRNKVSIGVQYHFN